MPFICPLCDHVIPDSVVEPRRRAVARRERAGSSATQSDIEERRRHAKPDYVLLGLDPKCGCGGMKGHTHQETYRCSDCPTCGERIMGIYWLEHTLYCERVRDEASHFRVLPE